MTSRLCCPAADGAAVDRVVEQIGEVSQGEAHSIAERVLLAYFEKWRDGVSQYADCVEGGRMSMSAWMDSVTERVAWTGTFTAFDERETDVPIVD